MFHFPFPILRQTARWFYEKGQIFVFLLNKLLNCSIFGYYKNHNLFDWCSCTFFKHFCICRCLNIVIQIPIVITSDFEVLKSMIDELIIFCNAIYSTSNFVFITPKSTFLCIYIIYISITGVVGTNTKEEIHDYLYDFLVIKKVLTHMMNLGSSVCDSSEM